MPARDRRRDLPGGVGCPACGAGVPADRIVVLATRDDLRFVESRCPSCSTVALELVIADAGMGSAERGPGGVAGDRSPGDRSPGDRSLADRSPVDAGPFAGSRPISEHDVRRMHRFLATHRGGLRELLEPDDLAR